MKSMTKLMVVAMILAAALVVAPVAAARTISSGDTIYVGEENLNLTDIFQGAVGDSGNLVRFSGSLSDRNVVQVIQVSNITSFDLTATAVGSGAGTTWQAFKAGADYTNSSVAPDGRVLIENPSMNLRVLLGKTGTTSVDGQSVSRTSEIRFRIDHNLAGLNTGMPHDDYNLVEVRVTTPSGGTVTTLGGEDLKVHLDQAQWTETPVISVANLPTGTYTARAVWSSNSADLTDSNSVTFEVTSGAVAIEADKDSVVRGNDFSVTITGESEQYYWVNITTSASTGKTQPELVPNQVGWQSGYGDETHGLFKTTAGGTRTVAFTTNSSTDAKTYTIEVAGPVNSTGSAMSGVAVKTDSVKVRVEEGSVTITASGTGTYYVGEEITLSGTCTESDTVYLFMTGPNLGSEGVNPENLTRLNNAQPLAVDVEGDDTWSYDWDTGNLGALEAGGYTIYAVSEPRDRNNLSGAKYATATIQLRPGFVTATVSGATVASGDDIKITGTAQGSTNDVQIWIFGKNFYGDAANSRVVNVETVSVEDDGTFEYELDNTELLSSGQYFVIVQHPMSGGYAVGTNGRYLTGPGLPAAESAGSVDLTQLTASAAANAVINALNSPYSDDKYTKLTFFLEDAWIRIDPIGDQSAGSTFTITGTTNLAAGGELIVEVTSAAFQPGAAGETSGFSSDAGTVTIQQGETANTWSFEVDGTTFRPDQYTVTVESIETQTSTSTTFNIVEGPAPTPTGTETTTPTGTETTTPTGTTTTEPTPTQSPGFGALVALAGLGAVAFLVLRRD